MLKISKEKLAAYEKATTAEENRVTVCFDGNRKSFEVYGTYYTGRRRNSAFGWHKVTQADAAEYLKKYGLTVQEFAVIASNEYEEEESVEENTEVTVEEEKEFIAVTAVNTNYETGVYRWYYKHFKNVASAFRYLWNKRKNYKGTTEFIFEIEEVDGDVIFHFDSAAKDYDLEIKNAEVQKLYDKANGYDTEETISYCTNRGNVREVKNGETGYTPQKTWYYYHEVAGLPEESVIEIARDLYAEDGITALCKFIANDTDGSNDDPDEDEIITIDITDDNDDDELVDEPADTEEVKKVGATADLEEELAEVNQQINELAKKAAAIENEIANRKLIEVTDEIVAAAAVDASIEAMTAVTFDLQAFNDDEPEVTVEENVDKEVDVTKLENELRLAKEYADKCKRDIAYYSRQILEYYGCIAKCEDFILKAHLKSLEAEKDVAAIEKKIATAEAIKHGNAKFSFPADTK